jgi:hypothetical protein
VNVPGGGKALCQLIDPPLFVLDLRISEWHTGEESWLIVERDKKKARLSQLLIEKQGFLKRNHFSALEDLCCFHLSIRFIFQKHSEGSTKKLSQLMNSWEFFF